METGDGIALFAAAPVWRPVTPQSARSTTHGHHGSNDCSTRRSWRCRTWFAATDDSTPEAALPAGFT